MFQDAAKVDPLVITEGVVRKVLIAVAVLIFIVWGARRLLRRWRG